MKTCNDCIYFKRDDCSIKGDCFKPLISPTQDACSYFKSKGAPKTEMEKSKFKPGDVVRLKSDFYSHHVMVVERPAKPVTPDDGLFYYHCIWFNDAGHFQPGVFREAVLEVAKKPAGI